jgi:hypothetical protein
MTSCIPIALVVLAYAFLPFVNPAVRDVQGITAKIETGGRELVEEIRVDLQKLERELPSPKNPRTSPTDEAAKPPS